MMGGRWKDGSEEISFESSSKREEISYVTFSEILCPIGATRGNGPCSPSKFSPWGWEWSSIHDSAISLHLAPEAGALTAHHCCALAPTCQWGALEGDGKEGARSWDLILPELPIPLSPCWLRFFTPMVAFPVHSSGRLNFAVFLTLTEPLSSHRLRDPHQLSRAFSELRPSRTGRGFQKWYPPPSPPPGDSHSSHHHRRRIPCSSFVYLVA